MNYYSTNHQSPRASLAEAVVNGLAPDRGLYMPEHIKTLPQEFFDHIDKLSFQDIASTVADAFFGDDVDAEALREIVCDTLSFDCPLHHVERNIYALELFHGPTLAFKDVGARFMARLLRYFIQHHHPAATINPSTIINVLVATSGDTGSAVANGFLGVSGIHVYVLYPKGKVSQIQESQFTTLGQNITAIAIDGTFDDCQALVKAAFVDADLCQRMPLTSANSINVARFLPQSFYYFNAYARLKAMGRADNMVVCVPSGNFGNLAAALFAQRMGLPVKRLIAATNANDVVLEYLKTGRYRPRPSVQTIANAMDVGNPSNFARILALYGADHQTIATNITGAAYADTEIEATIRRCHTAHGYLLDPHGACGYQALCDLLHDDETGIFAETAHPAKFKDTIDRILGVDLPIPPQLAAFMQGEKQISHLSNNYEDFRDFLLACEGGG